MAKIKQVRMKLELNPERPYQETVINIYYDATDRETETYSRKIPEKRFYIKLPQVVADALSIADARGNDQAEVMERFVECLDKFKTLKTEVNRIIVYRFEVRPHPDDKVSPYDYSYSVGISCATYEETIMTAGDGVKRYSYKWMESEVNIGQEFNSMTPNDGKRAEKQVPWNEKNTAFFIWIKTSMKELIRQLYELEQPDKLIETINTGRLLPLGTQQPKQKKES